MSRQNYIMSIYIRRDPGNTVFLNQFSLVCLHHNFLLNTRNLPVSTIEKEDLRFFRGLVSVQMPFFSHKCFPWSSFSAEAILPPHPCGRLNGFYSMDRTVEPSQLTPKGNPTSIGFYSSFYSLVPQSYLTTNVLSVSMCLVWTFHMSGIK